MRNYFSVFIFTLLTVSCSKANDQPQISPAAFISALNCSSAVATKEAVVGSPYLGTITVPYTGGSGALYYAGIPVASTGATGLTATLEGGTLAVGAGNLSYTISGTPVNEGTASFAISFGKPAGTISLSVLSDKPLTQYGTPFIGVPDPADATIYQVNMRAFSSTRNFRGVIDRLDSIKALGINVIYLMPTYPVGILKSINSLYCVRDYSAVNSEFGTLSDLRNLVDGAHSRGMAVIMDWVANHTSWDNGWISSHKDWYQQDAAGNIIYPILGWTDVAQLNFTNPAMRKEMIRLMKYWVYTANCDGYRCDYADGPPADFWKQAIDTLRNISTHKLLLLAEGTRSDHFASGFNYIFGFSFYTQMKSIFSSNQPVTKIDNLNTTEYVGAGDGNRVVRYLTNHDVNSTDGSPLSLFGGIPGSLAAFIVTAYMKGVPMIYNGQEVATSYPLYVTTTGKTITWNQNQSVLEEYKRIIAFRNHSLAVRRGDLVSYSNADVCAFTKTFGAEKVLVIVNLRNESLKYNLPGGMASMVWKDAFSGIPVNLNSQLSLPPYSYLVFSN